MRWHTCCWHCFLLTRMQAKGSSVIRASKWRLRQQFGRSQAQASIPAEAPASTPALVVSVPSPPMPSVSLSAATPPASRGGNEVSCGSCLPAAEPEHVGETIPVDFDGAAVLRPSTGAANLPAEAAHQQHLLPSFSPADLLGPVGGELVPTSDCRAADLEEKHFAPPSCGAVEPSAAELSRRSPRQSAGPGSFTSGRRSPGSNDEHSKSGSPPLPASPALVAALAGARGIGGRLGTPLGSPYPAPGKDWAAGNFASVSAGAAARRAARSGVGIKPSAPGSRFFPPFTSASSSTSSVPSPVVFEMVQDAADDEEDVAAAAAAVTATNNGAVGRGAGWHGLMLYR